CYSAMVIQDAKKLGVRFHARVQYEDYLQLMRRRLAGERILVNKEFETQFVSGAAVSPEEREIAGLIEDWHRAQVSKCEEELFKQKKRLADAERALASKPTKKAENDRRIAGNKIEKLLGDIKRHSTREILGEAERSIYPMHYFSIVC